MAIRGRILRRRHLLCVFSALVALACGGRSRTDDSSGATSTGSAGTNAGGSAAGGADSAATCPTKDPNEGDACPTSGLRCPGYGSLSCPATAICVAGTWQINCPAMMLGGGACGCAHHDFGRVPEAHRSAPVACSHQRTPSMPTPGDHCITPNGSAPCPGSSCSQDSDCTAGENGRCMQLGPVPGYACNYDECFVDSDCGKGSVCQCRDPLDGAAANYCTKPSSCSTDDDCEMYCSPSQAHEWCRAFYMCHSAQDECLNDSDCQQDLHCDYDVTVQHWACGNGCGPAPP
ncbi:MAG: hypothetical protein ABI548_16635 [Polyangiaceae bacterium]